jgi:hypothetical protein
MDEATSIWRIFWFLGKIVFQFHNFLTQKNSTHTLHSIMRIVAGLLLLLSLDCCARAQGSETLGTLHLSEQVRKEIQTYLIKANRDNYTSDAAAKEDVLLSGASLLQLELKGPQAVLIAGPREECGATGNCPLVIFRQVKGHAVPILPNGFGGLSGQLTTYHHGLLDIATYANSSCCEGGTEVYHFDGKIYRPAFCYSNTVVEQNNGETEYKEGPHVRCQD